MWKKDEVPDRAPAPRAEPAVSQDRPYSGGASAERATIGRSITIRGEVRGNEDLLIQGTVDGSVNLDQHAVTVGQEGEVKADIVARLVTVEGRVTGNLTALEQVVLRGTAVVQGDITAPRVVLEDGARFRGGVDMGDTSDNRKPAAGGVRAEAASGASGSRSAAGEKGRAEDAVAAPQLAR